MKLCMENKRLTFVTSNNVKLAHARHICKGYDFELTQHKKVFYGVGYDEPRITDRDSLLKSSIEDAIKRWKRYASENQLFFIEDTSVVIDALSEDGKEVPGVDVKYWMQNKTFAELNAQLRERGNNRNVTVHSHVVLFLTKGLQSDGEPPYKIFHGYTHGRIVENEHQFETNILYPWLDNKSFNKWFIPDGYNKPISMLDIDDANEVDFRRKSIQEMLKFLETSGAIQKIRIDSTPIQSEFNFQKSYIICGQTCAGKSTAGQYFLEKYGYYHIEASDFMTLAYFETCGTSFYVDKNIFAAQLLKADPHVVVRGLCKYMCHHKIFNRFIITGFRNKEEVLNFMSIYKQFDFSNILYVDAKYWTRYRRWKNRRRDNILYTVAKFKEINQRQKNMGVVAISKIDKNIVTIPNNGTQLENYYHSLDALMDYKNKAPHNLEFDKLTNIISIKLEKAILLALMTKYYDDKYFTTTEIASLINNVFTSICKRKNKNNISRYFNQAFYPYYEIKRDENNVIKYKLSPTGYSEAIMIYRHLLETSAI